MKAYVKSSYRPIEEGENFDAIQRCECIEVLDVIKYYVPQLCREFLAAADLLNENKIGTRRIDTSIVHDVLLALLPLEDVRDFLNQFTLLDANKQ